MEERGQSSNGERSDHGYVQGGSFDYSEHRRCGHISMNNEAKETLKQDRVSTMPDSILLHILSFLPINDTIKTGILSQRWLYLWTSTPNLCFTCTFQQPGSPLKFATFVDKALLSHRHCRINKFVFRFEYKYLLTSCIDRWVHCATSANVEELCLLLLNEHRGLAKCYVLPQHIYINSSMMQLRLTTCNVVPDGLISWKSLKSLLIGHTNLSKDVIQKILVGAPVLESLELFGCCGFNRLDIGSASLRKLVIRDYADLISRGDDSVLEISAPNLQSLGVVGNMYCKKFRLMNIQSLDDCNLNFGQTTYDDDYDNDYEEQRNMIGELLNRLHHVKKLMIGNWCIQVLSFLELKGMLSAVFKCKCLILDTFILRCDFPGVAGLLQSSLNLETLVINMTSLYGLDSLYDSECHTD